MLIEPLLVLLLGADMRLDAVLAVLADREEAFRSFSVVLEYEKQNAGSAAPLRGKETMMADSTGRLRVTTEEQAAAGTSSAEINPKRLEQVYDGTTFKALTSARERAIDGRVALRPAFGFAAVSPWEMVTTWFGEPISKSKYLKGARLVEFSDSQPNLVLIETAPIHDKEDRLQRRLRLLLDRTRGFAVVKKSSEYCYDGSKQWLPYRVEEALDHFEVVTGIWVPQRFVIESYQTWPERRELVARITGRLRDWKVNIDLPASLFSLTFPPGIGVTDEATGKSYYVSNVTENDVKSEVERAKELLEQRSHSGWLATIVVMSLVVLTAVIVCSVLRFRRGK